MTQEQKQTLRVAIKTVLRDELLHPYHEQGNMEAYRAIEKAMSVVDRVINAFGK